MTSKLKQITELEQLREHDGKCIAEFDIRKESLEVRGVFSCPFFRSVDVLIYCRYQTSVTRLEEEVASLKAELGTTNEVEKRGTVDEADLAKLNAEKQGLEVHK